MIVWIVVSEDCLNTIPPRPYPNYNYGTRCQRVFDSEKELLLQITY